MRPRMKKILKISLWTLLGIFILCAGLVLTLLAKPGWFVNEWSASRLLSRYGKPYQLRWDDIEVKVTSPRWFNYDVKLAGKNLCFGEKSASIQGCLEKILVDANLQVALTGVKRLTIRDLEILSQQITQRSVENTATKEQPKKERKIPKLPNIRLEIPFVKEMKIEKASAVISKFLIEKNGQNQMDGSATLKVEAPSEVPILKVNASLKDLMKQKTYELTSQIQSSILTEGTLKTLAADGKISASPYSSTFKLLMGKTKHEDESQISLVADAEGPNLHAQVNLEGSQSKTKTRIQGRMEADRFQPGGKATLRMNHLDLNAQTNEEGQLQSLHLVTPLLMSGGGAKLANIPKTIEGFINAELITHENRTNDLEGKISIDIKKIGDWAEAVEGNISTEFSGSTAELTETIRENFNVRVRLEVLKFEALVNALRGTPYSIPAPLNSLAGSMHLSADASRKGADQNAAFSFGIYTDMKSEKQALALVSKGEGSIENFQQPNQMVNLKGELVLENVAIQLPYLKIQDIPQLKIERRVSTGKNISESKAPEVVEASSKNKIDFRVHTKDLPVRLLTNLTKDPVPLLVDYWMKPDGSVTQDIRIQPFRVEMFRRIANVDHVNLNKKQDSKYTDLDGLVLYKTTDYTVRIELVGTIEKPRMQMRSEPPLEEEQIMALLIFGKPTGLNADEMTTVGNAGAAVASGALGIASLYIFASTPIESVGYNPATQTYSVRVRVPGGVSIELGSNFESSQYVAFRKRLGAHWAILTELQRLEQEKYSAATFLQWFKRF